MTFKKIVVGLDQSFKDSSVFTRALEQAKPHSSSIMIVHTLLKSHPSNIEISLPIGQQAEVARDMYSILARQHQERLERSKRQAESWLELYFQQAIATQVNCQSGNPGLWLCEMAQRWGADLIVIGHCENHGLRSVGNRSVTQYVLQHAPCAVLVIQGEMPLPQLHDVAQTEPAKPVTTPATARLASQMFKV
jgi:nucleotide-binding universal stress UspA family protein